MKTITEVNGFNLRNALKKVDELTAAGKTAEELPAALGEALKLEGDKLRFLMAAMELAKTRGKEIGDLKRVIVYALHDGEAAPSGLTEKEGNYYVAEYLASLNPPKQDRPGGERDGRDGKRGGGRGGRDAGGKPGGPGRGGERGAGGGGRGPRRDDAGRGPRPDMSAGGGAPKITPKITPAAPKITPKTDTPTS